MRWQAAAALAAAAFAMGDAAAAAIAASGANPILDPEAAMAAIPAALRAGRVFSAEAVPLCAGTACACGALLAWARSLGTKGARRDGEEHGSSRWATRKDIARQIQRHAAPALSEVHQALVEGGLENSRVEMDDSGVWPVFVAVNVYGTVSPANGPFAPVLIEPAALVREIDGWPLR